MNDLRDKISTGVIPKSLSIPYKPSVTEKLFPPYLSTRASAADQHSHKPEAYSIPVTLPLLPVEGQSVKIEFYAGQRVNCPLPSPLGINEAYMKAIDSRRTSAADVSYCSRVGSRVSVKSCLTLTEYSGMMSREQTLTHYY